MTEPAANGSTTPDMATAPLGELAGEGAPPEPEPTPEEALNGSVPGEKPEPAELDDPAAGRKLLLFAEEAERAIVRARGVEPPDPLWPPGLRASLEILAPRAGAAYRDPLGNVSPQRALMLFGAILVLHSLSIRAPRKSNAKPGPTWGAADDARETARKPDDGEEGFPPPFRPGQ